MPDISKGQRNANLRTGLVLGAVALFFFLAVIFKYYLLKH